MQNETFVTAIPMAVETDAQSKSQEDVLRTEAFLEGNYQFRFNVLSKKTEYKSLTPNSLVEKWEVLDERATNDIVLTAKREGVSKCDPAKNIVTIIHSSATPLYDPIRDYLTHLPEWDGIDRVTALFSRIPGTTPEQKFWCSIWMRSVTAQWLQKSEVYGNACLPVLIGPQGCGKSTFCTRLLPREFRAYFMDNINLANRFDAEMALTNNLLVNIDEFDRYNARQQASLKQYLSRVKVNGRHIYGDAQEDRIRYASFIATTNCAQPLTDPTGSRRFICIRIPQKQYIDNTSPIDYDQLFAQLLHEINEGKRYWFSNEEVADIERANLPYRREMDMQSMLRICFRFKAPDEEGKSLTMNDILEVVHAYYPEVSDSRRTRIDIGTMLKEMGCVARHTKIGMVYDLVPLA